jgi:hypothetical protein
VRVVFGGVEEETMILYNGGDDAQGCCETLRILLLLVSFSGNFFQVVLKRICSFEYCSLTRLERL